MNTFKFYLTLATIALLSIGNTNLCFGQNEQKIYKNIMENKAEQTKSIYFYNGKDDKNLKPTKQYTIKYNPDQKPIEKIKYEWNNKTQEWTILTKYSYSYKTNGEIENLIYAEWNNKTETWDERKEFSILDFDITKEFLTLNEY